MYKKIIILQSYTFIHISVFEDKGTHKYAKLQYIFCDIVYQLNFNDTDTSFRLLMYFGNNIPKDLK